MKRPMVVCAVLTVTGIFGAAAVRASGWVKICEGSSGGAHTTLLDPQSVKSRDGQLTAWTKHIFLKAQKDPTTGALYTSSAELMAYDCSNDRYALLELVRYVDGRNGIVKVETSISIPPQSLSWSYVPPNTEAEILLARVCNVQKAIEEVDRLFKQANKHGGR